MKSQEKSGKSFFKKADEPCVGHVIKGSCGFKGESISWSVITLPRLVSTGILLVEICQVILQDHVTKRSGNFMGKSTSRLVTILPSLLAKGML